jgi:tetratricopeptide (TPR) repeat protein
LAAEKALIRLYERHQCWDDLLGLFEQDLTRTSDRDQVMAILSRMAEVYEERKLDSRKAVETLRRILEVAPDHLATLRNLARVCERAGFWDELIRVHELEASLVGDAKQVISLVHRVAEIYDEQLHQKEQAIAAYQKLLTLAPTYLPALKGLGRLYAQAGRWAELVDMYRQEAEITAAPDQAAGLLFNAGELLEERLEKLDEAIAVYHEALTLAPTYVPALRALARIHRSQKSWESLVEVLRAEAAARGDSAERANTLFQVAALWEDELRRADLAIETNLEVLALVPDHVPALRALERLFAAQRQLDGGVAYEARLDLLLRLGELLEWRLGEEEQALACYRQVLALEAGHLPALCAARRVLTHQGEHREAFKLAMAAGNALRDPSSAVEMLLEASALALEKLKDRAAACDAYQAVLARDPLQARAAKKLKELMSGADSPRRAPRPRKPARK